MVKRQAIERMWRHFEKELLFDHGGYETVDLFSQMYVCIDDNGVIRNRLSAWLRRIPVKRSYVGEDVAFFLRAAKCGLAVECLVDGDINHAGIPYNLAKYFDKETSSHDAAAATA